MAFWHWRRGKVLATAPSAVCAVEDREPEATEFSMERALDEAIRQLTKGKNFVVLANVGNLRTEEVINCHPAQQPRIASGARILSKYMSALAVKFQEA